MSQGLMKHFISQIWEVSNLSPLYRVKSRTLISVLDQPCVNFRVGRMELIRLMKSASSTISPVQNMRISSR